MGRKWLAVGFVVFAFLGFLLSPQKQTTPTLDSVEQELLTSPETSDKYIDLANHYRSQGLYEKAEIVSLRVIELDPENETPYIQLANQYRLEKRFQESEMIIEKLLIFAPASEKASLALGNIYRDQGKLDEAERWFLTAISANPKSNQPGNAYSELAKLYRQQGRITEALQMEEKVPSASAQDGL